MAQVDGVNVPRWKTGKTERFPGLCFSHPDVAPPLLLSTAGAQIAIPPRAKENPSQESRGCFTTEQMTFQLQLRATFQLAQQAFEHSAVSSPEEVWEHKETQKCFSPDTFHDKGLPSLELLVQCTS